ncbi:site-specific integrase [Plebeiibacterium sediminum]|uniref:Site-specific integrase n=1 Tax=Plebeiibacterium sediminum TaxID=2992112 RepID=A0AAE3SGN0_9BACT|nr:site-specific integrase [Plebeiobacterium sediminum]MCW3788506.1 site-specific integrase [Plebeiobacterium sediminum]
MANATVSIFLDSSYTKKDGTSRFYIRVTLNRKTKKIPLNLFLKPDYYNPKTKKIKEIREVPDAKKNNLYLKDKESEVEQIIIELERRKQPVTFESILSLYSNSEVNGSFIEFAKTRLKEERNRIKASTYKGLEFGIIKLERYQANVTIYEIDENWLEKYRNYLIEHLNNKPNTIYDSMSMIRKFITYAHKKNIIDRNPFSNFSFLKEDGKKDHLSLKELDMLHDYYNSEQFLKIYKKDNRGKTYLTGMKYQETLQHILISCYCGLRLSDLKKLRFKHIENNMIIMPMEKSRKDKEKMLRIPITERLKSVLDLDGDKKPNDKIYQGFVRNSSDINPMLRFIMNEVGIKKRLSFHCTRHTFAVSALTLGMSLETVSDIMGHNDLRTTQIYAKIIDDKRKEEMSKWNRLNNLNNENINHARAICPNCDNEVFSFEKGVIKIKKLTLQCQSCSTKFSYVVE